MNKRTMILPAVGLLAALAAGCMHDEPKAADGMNGNGSAPATNSPATVNQMTPAVNAKQPGDAGNVQDHYHPMTDDTNQYGKANASNMGNMSATTQPAK